MWNLICQNRAELIMASLPYLFVPIHTVKVCPMLLKIGHVVLVTYGNGKLEALEIGDLTQPSRFRDATPKKLGFASRVQVEEFVKMEFLDVYLEDPC